MHAARRSAPSPQAIIPRIRGIRKQQSQGRDPQLGSYGQSKVEHESSAGTCNRHMIIFISHSNCWAVKPYSSPKAAVTRKKVKGIAVTVPSNQEASGWGKDPGNPVSGQQESSGRLPSPEACHETCTTAREKPKEGTVWPLGLKLSGDLLHRTEMSHLLWKAIWNQVILVLLRWGFLCDGPGPWYWRQHVQWQHRCSSRIVTGNILCCH